MGDHIGQTNAQADSTQQQSKLGQQSTGDGEELHSKLRPEPGEPQAEPDRPRYKPGSRCALLARKGDTNQRARSPLPLPRFCASILPLRALGTVVSSLFNFAAYKACTLSKNLLNQSLFLVF